MTPRPWFCLAALSGVLALVGIDMTVLNVTLPHLTEQLARRLDIRKAVDGQRLLASHGRISTWIWRTV